MSSPAVLARGRVVTLRQKQASDALDDYHWRRDRELARYDGRQPFEGSFSEFLQQFQAEIEFPDPSWRMVAIDADGDHVGNILCYRIDNIGGSCEIGITVGAEDRRGQGIGTDAVVTFLRYAWSALHMRLVYLHTFEWNERARRCFERSGFELTTVLERPAGRLLRYEARREWWLMRDEQDPYPRAAAREQPDAGEEDSRSCHPAQGDSGRSG